MNVFEPNDPFLKKYIDGICRFKKGQKEIKYASCPSAILVTGNISYFAA